MDDVLRNALQDYEQQFGTRFDPTWNPSTKEDLAEQITKSKIDFETWRSKHQKVWQALSTCALPVANMGKTVADSISSSFAPASAAINGLVLLISACESVSEAYDFIEQMFVQLSDALVRWEIDFNHEISDFRKQQVKQIIVLILLIIVRSRKLIKRGRLGSYLTTWAFGKDEKTSELMQELDKLLVSEDRTRATLSLDRINDLWQRAIRTGNTQVVERLNSSAVEITARMYAERTEEMVRDTGKWLERDQLYQRWLQRKSPLLLLLGGPGSGKTSVATSIIGNLVRKQRQDELGSGASSIGYFYVSTGIDLVTMLKAIAYQLQELNSSFREFVVDIFEQGGVHTSNEVWKKLFLGFWNKATNPEHNLFLVIDGLDEMDSDEVEKFGDIMVREMAKDNVANINLCICGRPTLWTNFAFVSPDGYVRVDVEKTAPDIAKYIDEKLAKVRILRKSPTEERGTYRDLILESCDGNFEWARLLVTMCKNLEKSQIRKRLESSPKGLDQMIESYFDQILANEEIEPNAIRSVLTWLTYSKRPLLFGELYRYVVMSTGDHHGLLWFHIVKYLSTVVQWRTSRNHRTAQVDLSEDSIEELYDETDDWSRALSLTQLTFQHSRIRDYIIERSNSSLTTKREANETESDQYLPSKEQADQDAVKVCLQMLRGLDVIHQPGLRVLSVYPVVHMVHHLSGVDFDNIDNKDRSDIIDGLIWLFHDERGHRVLLACMTIEELQGFTDFWTTWLTSNQHSRLVQKWLGRAGKQKYVNDPVILAWLERASQSTRSMFEPLSKSLYKTWLCGDWVPLPFEDYTYVTSTIWAAFCLLTAYQRMDDDGNLPSELQIFHNSQVILQTVDDVRRLASKSKFPQTASYHVGLASAFMETGQSGPVIYHSRIAYAQDSSCWIAAWYIAQASAMMLDMKSALSWAAVTRDLNSAAGSTIEGVRALWFLQIHDLQSALPLAKNAYSLQQTDLAAVSTYFVCLGLNNEGGKMLDIIQATQALTDHRRGQSIFTRFMRTARTEVWYMLGRCYTLCPSPRDKKSILEALEASTTTISQYEDEAQQVGWSRLVATFHLAYVEGGYEFGMKTLDQLIPRVRETKQILATDERKIELSKIISDIVAWKYRKLCTLPLTTASDLSAFTADIITLAALVSVSDPAYKADDELATALYPLLMVIRFAQHGRESDTERWRQLIRPAIRRYVRMLDDDNPKNDPIGLVYLQKIFSIMGDTKRASVLLHVMMIHFTKTLVKYPEPTDSSPQDNRTSTPAAPLSEVDEATQGIAEIAIAERAIKLNFDIEMIFYCFTCFCKVQAILTMHFCENCQRYYCERCVPQEAEPTLTGKACGSHHTFHEVWPLLPSEVDPSIIIQSGDNIYLSKTWIADIKKEWALE